MIATRIEITRSRPAAYATTIASALAGELCAMDGTYSIEVVLNEQPFTIHYDQEQALGDSGYPVRGDVTGEYELVRDDRVIFRQHVSPHGSSGYGNPGAKPWAAEQVLERLARSAPDTN